jgi:tetratricopeptide (TPR) repeat protein
VGSKFLSFLRPGAAATPVPSVDEDIERARQLHRGGQLEPALRLYGDILKTHPDSAQAHYYRANVLKDQGALAAAVAAYERAIALKPDYAHAFCNLAAVQWQLGKISEALGSYDRAIHFDPKDALAHFNRGLLLNGSGQKDAALASFDEAIACNPGFFPAHFARGGLLQERQQWAESLVSYDKAIALNPADASAHYNRGTVLKQVGRWPEALASFDRALAVNGQFARAHAARAEVLGRLDRLTEAVEGYDRAIALEPGDAIAHNSRGAALQTLRKFEAALASYNQALAANPHYAEAYYNQGCVLAELQDFDGALRSYDQALALKPDYADVYVNRALALENVGLLGEAITSIRRGIALNPDLAEGHFNLALLLLRTGDLLAGWAEYEWRWLAKSGPIFREKRVFHEPLWLGEQDISGKTILLYGEQGLGDALQFCRYAGKVAALGARVILEVPGPLVSLCMTLKGVAQVVRYADPLPSFDVQCPLMSLPLVFRTTLETIPAPSGYLRSDPGKVAAWQARLGTRTKPRVGLTWSGNQAPGTNRLRHFALELLLPYLTDACQYFCLQTDIRPEDRRTLEANPAIQQYQHEFKDFSDTAALCECMDLMLSVDTSVAHMSGAIGKSTWVMLTREADWRWLTDRTDNPWYPGMRLFRQANRGDWIPVFEQVGAELRRRFG